MSKKEKELLELKFCSAYRLYFNSLRTFCDGPEKEENLIRYQTMKEILEIFGYTNRDIRELEKSVEAKIAIEQIN